MIDPTVDQLLAAADVLAGAGGAAVVERDVLTVEGPDAAAFLQGQLSQDIAAIAVGDGAWSFVLAPTGKVDAWVRIHRVADDSFLIEVEADWGAVVRARLTRFLLRTKAQIGEPQRWALVQQRWGAESTPSASIPSGAIVAPAIGPNVHGIDALLRMGAGAAATHAIDDRVPPDALERHRLAHGIPRLGAELTDETIPGEAGQWVIDASVSFTKGCYTGQELVARIDSRGNNVPHPIRLLEVDADVSVGDVVVVDGAEVGAVTSAVPSLDLDHRALALARVGRAVTVGSECTIAGADARCIEPGTVR